MTITQQQQLALQRGLLYDIANNKLVTFDPVAANTKNVGQLPRISPITVTVPIDSEGLTETFSSVFPLSSLGATVNIAEEGKTVSDVAVWNRVQGVTGSKYIFIRDIDSAESIPAVGNFVESHPDVQDNMYENSTQITEINPTVTMKIIDILLQAKTIDTFQYAFVAIPVTPSDFKLPGDGNQGVIGPKFIFTISDEVDNAILTLDALQAFKRKLKQLLGYSDFADDSSHPQVTFRNLINDVFGVGNEIKGFGAGSPSLIVTSGRNQIRGYLQDGAEWGVPFVFVFEFYKLLSNCLIFSSGTDVPPTINPFGLVNPISDPILWNTPSPPAFFIFEDVLEFGAPDATVQIEPNTGDGGEPFNETVSDIACDLLCYKLSKPLRNFQSASISVSKTSVTNVVFGSTPVPTEVVYNGDSINKDSLLDPWEAGYHMAGRILQNKLKK